MTITILFLSGIDINVQNISDRVSKNPKTHILHLKVLNIALERLILVEDKCFTPYFSCLTLYQKPEKHEFLL